MGRRARECWLVQPGGGRNRIWMSYRRVVHYSGPRNRYTGNGLSPNTASGYIAPLT